MEAETIRRKYLQLGGNATDTAKALGLSRSAVYQALERAHKRSPLVVPAIPLRDLHMSQEDMEAVAAYVRACLEAAGIGRGENQGASVEE